MPTSGAGLDYSSVTRTLPSLSTDTLRPHLVHVDHYLLLLVVGGRGRLMSYCTGYYQRLGHHGVHWQVKWPLDMYVPALLPALVVLPHNISSSSSYPCLRAVKQSILHVLPCPRRPAGPRRGPPPH